MSGIYRLNPDNMAKILFHSVDNISKMYGSIKVLREYMNKTGQQNFSYTEIQNILDHEIIDQLIWGNVIVEDTASRMNS